MVSLIYSDKLDAEIIYQGQALPSPKPLLVVWAGKNSRKAQRAAENVSAPHISQKYLLAFCFSTRDRKREQSSNRLIHEFIALRLHPNSDSLLVWAF